MVLADCFDVCLGKFVLGQENHFEGNLREILKDLELVVFIFIVISRLGPADVGGVTVPDEEVWVI